MISQEEKSTRIKRLKLDYSNILFRYKIHPSYDYPRSCLYITGQAILRSGGGHTVETSEKSTLDDISDDWFTTSERNDSEGEQVGQLNAYLITRHAQINMHCVCDAISQEVADFSLQLFDVKGRRRHEDLKVVAKKKKSDSGGLLYTSVVSVPDEHRGNDIGLLLVHHLMKALIGRWTLAAVFPAQVEYPGSRELFDLIKTKLCRYFARLGFIQVSKRPRAPSNYWVLEADNFRETILSKADTASIGVYIPPRPVDVSPVEKEFNSYLNREVRPLLASAAMSSHQATTNPRTREVLEAVAKLEQDCSAIGVHHPLLARLREQVNLLYGGTDDPAMLRTEARRRFEAARIGVDLNSSRAFHFAAVNAATASNEFENGENFELLSMLLTAGANINHQDDAEMTPLMLVASIFCKRGNNPTTIGLIRWLLEHGADKHMRDADQLTAVDHLLNSKQELSDLIAVTGIGNAVVDFDQCLQLLKTN